MNAEQKNIVKPTQENLFNTETMLPFSEVRNDTMILKDGGIRAILRVQGLNLDLKNGDEQEIIIEQYKKFLNGLEFPVQFLIRNTYLDLSMYLNGMKQKIVRIDNPVLQKYGNSYVQFLEDIDNKQGLVFVKEFYIIVPYYDGAGENSQVNKPRWSKILAILDAKDSAEKVVSRYRNFLKTKTFLDTRCSLIIEGLRGMGMSAERLENEEIISLMFKMYNPLLHSSQAQMVF